ncbi:MAG TPA: hypothetical protein VFO18_06090 [Methylomirabilota bacterium]|nr:hypothetical protein [Methylomirabilota bacterium]
MGIGPVVLFLLGLILIGALLYWRFSDVLSQGGRRVTVVEGTVRHDAQVKRADGQQQIVANGVSYRSVEEIPDPATRQAVQEALDKVGQTPPSQTTKTQVTVNRTFVVNGVTYHSLEEIPDPKLRERLAEALKKVE